MSCENQCVLVHTVEKSPPHEETFNSCSCRIFLQWLARILVYVHLERFDNQIYCPKCVHLSVASKQTGNPIHYIGNENLCAPDDGVHHEHASQKCNAVPLVPVKLDLCVAKITSYAAVTFDPLLPKIVSQVSLLWNWICMVYCANAIVPAGLDG